jgi:hypothetical protein
MSSGLKEEVWGKNNEFGIVPFNYPKNDTDLLLHILKVPSIVSENTDSIREINSKLESILGFLGNYPRTNDSDDRYMDAKEAAAYLGMCPNTFDKYRYKAKIKIKGYKLDGKVKYKKSELDLFMLTYNAKSQGLA